MKKRSIIRLGIVILAISLIVYIFRVKTSTVNRAYGGPVTIQFYGMDMEQRVKTNRTVELSYDLKKTIDEATSVLWFCKCPIQDCLVIDGEYYDIFGACGSQKGYQLVERGDKYYLIEKKLNIVKK